MSLLRSRSPLAVLLGLALALGGATGLLTVGCGPKQKFCPNTSDGICPIPMDAAPVDMGPEAPPEDKGSVYVGHDGGQD